MFRTVIDTVAAYRRHRTGATTAETPCSEWNYAQLLGHLTGGDLPFGGGTSPATRPCRRAGGWRLIPDGRHRRPMTIARGAPQLAGVLGELRGPSRDLRGSGGVG